MIKKDDRRSIRNYLLEPKLQLRLALYVGVSTLLAVAAASYFVGYMYQPLLNSLIQGTDKLAPQIFELLYENTMATVLIITVFTLLYIFIMTLLVIWYSHRFVGPIVAFRRHVKALIAGNTSARVKLRKYDAFTELADDLNALAEHYSKHK